ncbi:MAG: hypothetical protein IT237_00020 [Bacteroidia bacterium]|nr:hypothetical protein [Bacteroidia bacterium]
MIQHYINRRFILIVLILYVTIGAKAQDKTIHTANKTSSTSAHTKHKIMLIPFENRMYMSEIDFAINKETKLNAKQIKAQMRDGLNEQFYKKFKPKMGVVDLLDDTVKTQKDLNSIYQYLTYQYVRVPDQAHYKPPVKDKEEKAIHNGQITVETNTDERFMNAKLKNSTLVPYLYGKYKTDLFLFLNELDIKSFNAIPGDFNSIQTRKIILHYTVYTFDAREINSGVAEIDLPLNVNHPSKISHIYLSKLAEIVLARVEKALLPK